MAFAVPGDAYDRFMGRYSVPLAPVFADFAGVRNGMRVLDVGCGPGALTAELAARVGPSSVVAVDPSPRFVETARERHREVDVRVASAEGLPFDDGAFDAALAQLVVHFMDDPVAGLREMARATRHGGVVAACVWDHVDQGPLALFWRAARDLDSKVDGESELAGARQGHLGELFADAGLGDVESVELWIFVEHETFEDWWDPFTLGVGPAGTYVAGLDADARARLRAHCLELQPPAPFTVTARAWAARGRA